jgi:hypothetical protein
VRWIARARARRTAISAFSAATVAVGGSSTVNWWPSICLIVHDRGAAMRVVT